MTLAILCSGQGPQHPAMFALTADLPDAAGLFARATALLGGRDPRDLVRTESSDALHHNRTGQILCTLQALAAAVGLRAALGARPIIAGYSVGEVAAWGVAGIWSGAETLDLAARRAELMDAASPAGDGLLFVRGLPLATVERLCERHGAAIAIVNPGDAFVLGGSGPLLDSLAEEAEALRAARITRLPVEVASHTPRLVAAVPAFRACLARAGTSRRPAEGARLLSGIDGAPVVDVDEGLGKLAAQVAQTVRWADCLEACREAGATAFLELGPGTALSAMAAGSQDDIPARGLEDFRTLEGARTWLARQAVG